MSATETHLIKLQTYLSKHLRNRPGAKCIQHELVTTYLRSSHNESENGFKNSRTCPRCFIPWNEGNFAIKSKSKKSKSHVKKQVIVKCLVCLKLSVIDDSFGKCGVHWKCAKDGKSNQYSGTKESSKTSSKEMQNQKFRAIATLSNGKKLVKGSQEKRRNQIVPKLSVEGCSKIFQKIVAPNVSNDLPKKNRKRKFKMTSKCNQTDVSNLSSASEGKRKKVALNVLSDLL